MRSITRPLATAASAALLVFALAACGDNGDDKASDGKSPSGSTTSADASDGATSGSASGEPTELCGAISNIVTVVSSVSGSEPNEEEWGRIQEAYGALEDADLPSDIPAKEKEGLEVASKAITSLDYAEAKKAFGDKDGSSSIPGVSEADNAKAEAFFTWAAKACPNAVGGDSASSATEGASSATAE